MRMRRLAITFVLPVLVAACGADSSSQPPVQRTIGALTGSSVSTDLAIYSVGSTITVTYGGLPGNAHDWLGLAPAGSPDTTWVAWAYTGQNSGTATFTAPLTVGSYVVRAFLDDSLTRLAESASFTVTNSPMVSTNQSSYATSSTITVSYGGLPGNPHDWLGLAPAGAPDTTWVAWVYTGGQNSGTATFTAPLNVGSYVVRAFLNDSLTRLAETATFTVTTAPPAVSTNQSSYATGSTITVTYGGLPGNAHDWLGLAPAGAPDTTWVAWVYTGQNSGTATFTAPLNVGSYVVRAFLNDSLTRLAESASFTVTTANDGGPGNDGGTGNDGGPSSDGGTVTEPCGVLGWGSNTIAALAPHAASTVAFATPGGVLELRRASDGSRLGIDNGFLGATAVAYSGDGTVFAAATSDGVKVWRVSDSALLSTVPQLANTTALALSNDGSVIVGKGLTSIVVVRPSGVSTIPQVNVAGVGVAPDGSVVAAVSVTGSGSSAQYIDTAWRVSDGQQLWSVSAGQLVNSGSTSPRIVFSPDGTLAAFGGSSMNRGVHRVSDGLTLYFAGEPLAFTDDGLGLLTQPGTVGINTYSLVRVSDGAVARSFNIPTGTTILAGGFSTGTTTVVVLQSAEDHQLFVDGALARSIPHPGRSTNAVALSPDGVWAASGDASAKIRIWKTATATLAATLSGGPLRRQVAAFSPDSTQLATVADRRVTIYRLKDGAGPPFAAPQLLRTISVDAHAVALSAGGALIATGNVDATAQIWSGVDGSLLRTLWNLSGHTGNIDGIAFSPDESMVATASADGTIKLWRTADGSELRTITNGSAVDTVRFSPDGAWVMSSQFPGSSAKIWDAASGTLVRSVPGVSNAVIAAPTSTLFIGTGGSASAIGRFGLPDFTDRGPVPQSATGALARFIDVTPTGSLLAGGMDAGVVRLWCSP